MPEPIAPDVTADPNPAAPPTIDTTSQEFLAAVAEKVETEKAAYEGMKEEYETGSAEVKEYADAFRNPDIKLAVEAFRRNEQVKFSTGQDTPAPRPQDADAAFHQFYQNAEKRLVDEGQVDATAARQFTREIMGANHELVKLMKEREIENDAKWEKRISAVQSESANYREGRIFQDLSHANPMIGKIPFNQLPAEVVSDGKKLFDKEGGDAIAQLERALGRWGGKAHVEMLAAEKQRSEAAEGLPAGGMGFTPDRIRTALNGKQVRGTSLDERIKLFSNALEEA